MSLVYRSDYGSLRDTLVNSGIDAKGNGHAIPPRFQGGASPRSLAAPTAQGDHDDLRLVTSSHVCNFQAPEMHNLCPALTATSERPLSARERTVVWLDNRLFMGLCSASSGRCARAVNLSVGAASAAILHRPRTTQCGPSLTLLVSRAAHSYAASAISAIPDGAAHQVMISLCLRVCRSSRRSVR